MNHLSKTIQELAIAATGPGCGLSRAETDRLLKLAEQADNTIAALVEASTAFLEYRGVPQWRKPPTGRVFADFQGKEFATMSVERGTWEALIEAIEAAHRGAREGRSVSTPEAAPAPAAPTPAPEAQAPAAAPQRAPAPLSDSDIFDD